MNYRSPDPDDALADEEAAASRKRLNTGIMVRVVACCVLAVVYHHRMTAGVGTPAEHLSHPVTFETGPPSSAFSHAR